LTAASIHGFFARDADLGDFILAVWLGPAGLLLLFAAVAMTRRSPVRWACQALPILWLAATYLLGRDGFEHHEGIALRCPGPTFSEQPNQRDEPSRLGTTA